MKAEFIKDLFAKFEEVASVVDGVECWSARDIYPLFGYTQWRGFQEAINRAKESCKNASCDVLSNFADIRKIVKTGVSEKKIDDILLTRYACYLVAQNGDPRKPEIAFAQTYFAVQTRKAEIIAQRLEEHERVAAREKLKETEKQLSEIVYERGVEDSRGFAQMRSKGDYALFHLTTEQAKIRFKVPKNRPLADFLPTIDIKAKDFAAAMTSTNIKQKDLVGQRAIEAEHIYNNRAVRSMMIHRGIVPENQPPAEDIKKVQQRIDSDTKKLIKEKSQPKVSDKVNS